MKRFMITVMILFVAVTGSYGADTADSEIYVRKEVFSAYMDSINSKFDVVIGEMKQIREDMKQMREEMKQMRDDMKEEIKGIKNDMSQMREEMKEEIKGIKNDMSQMREEMKGEIKGIKNDMSQMREEMKGEIKAQGEEIKSLRQDLNEIARAIAVLSQRINSLEARFADTQNYLYLLLVLLGIIVALPFVQRFLEWKDSRKPSITLEDVKRLIEESKSEARGA